MGHSEFRPFYANQSSELNFPYFSSEKQPEFRRKRDLYEPLLTAMAQVLPSLRTSISGPYFPVHLARDCWQRIHENGRQMLNGANECQILQSRVEIGNAVWAACDAIQKSQNKVVESRAKSEEVAPSQGSFPMKWAHGARVVFTEHTI